MKKRVFSFVIMIVTLIAVIAFGSPNIKNNSKPGMEFNGGFDILYAIEAEDGDLSKKELAKTAAEGIEKRLDIANIIDPIVSVESNEYVRVTVSASSQIVADEIRDIIETNAEISFRDFENNLLATGEEILKDVGATLSEETDMEGNPIIFLNIKDTELLSRITEEVSGKTDTHLVVWLGFEEGDDYANLETDASVAKKIIYNATVSSKLDTETISVTGGFSKSMAESTVALINSGTLDYDLDVLQISTVDVDTAAASYNKVLIAAAIAMVLVISFLCVNYKLGGLVSSLVLVFNTFLTLTLFVAFKGIVNQQTIAALILAIAISTDAIVVLLERVNNETYTGKNLERSLNEGYKKSVHSIVDANIVVLIMAIVMYFLGNSVANFALLLSLSSITTLVVMTVLNKFALSTLVKLKVKQTAFGAKKAYLEDKEKYLASKSSVKNPLTLTKKYFLGAGAFAAVAVIVMLVVLQLTIGSMFNYNSTISGNSSVTIVSNVQKFTDNAHIMEFFDQEGVEIELSSIKSSTFKKDGITKYKVTVETKNSVTAVEKELTNKVIELFGKNEEYAENYELYINDINPKSTLISFTNALYTVGIGLLVVAIYLTIKYRYSYALAALASTVSTILLTGLFFGLTRIPVGSDIVITIFAVTIFALNTLVITFNRSKEMIGNNGKKYISNEERREAIVKGINATLPRTIMVSLVAIIVSIALLAFSSLNSYSFYLALIIGLVLNVINTVIISSQVWLLFEKLSDKRKRTFKPKKDDKKRIFKDEQTEQTFIGIND